MGEHKEWCLSLAGGTLVQKDEARELDPSFCASTALQGATAVQVYVT